MTPHEKEKLFTENIVLAERAVSRFRSLRRFSSGFVDDLRQEAHLILWVYLDRWNGQGNLEDYLSSKLRKHLSLYA